MKDTTKLRRDKKIADHNKPATEEPTSRQKRRQEDSSIQMPVATGAMLSAILAARPGRLEINVFFKISGAFGRPDSFQSDIFRSEFVGTVDLVRSKV